MRPIRGQWDRQTRTKANPIRTKFRVKVVEIAAVATFAGKFRGNGAVTEEMLMRGHRAALMAVVWIAARNIAITRQPHDLPPPSHPEIPRLPGSIPALRNHSRWRHPQISQQRKGSVQRFAGGMARVLPKN